jgi:hypothetical protein
VGNVQEPAARGALGVSLQPTDLWFSQLTRRTSRSASSAGFGAPSRQTNTTLASSFTSGTNLTPPSRKLRDDSGRRVTPTPAATSASRFCGVLPRATTRGRKPARAKRSSSVRCHGGQEDRGVSTHGSSASVETEEILREPVAAVLPQGHPLATRSELTLVEHRLSLWRPRQPVLLNPPATT